MAVRALNASTAAPIAIQQHTGWRAAERDSRQMLDALDVAVYTTDREGRLTFFNDAAALFWGRKPELGELWCGSYKLFYPDGSAMPHDECPMAGALRASNAVKAEFLGLVSHELRTPVTTIFGNARLLRDRGDRLAESDRESMVSDIAGEAERLLGVVENLLLLTRLESGIHPDPEPQVLAHVARMMLDSFERRHPDRSIELRSEPRHLI